MLSIGDLLLLQGHRDISEAMGLRRNSRSLVLLCETPLNLEMTGLMMPLIP